MKQGLVLKKIRRVLHFRQSHWMKPYIMLNTTLRAKATNDFEKNFYKLLNNAIYGKTMENVRSRADIRLKTKWDGRYGVRKLFALPNFKKYTYFDTDLVAIELSKTNIKMDKPIAVGMSVLDISKELMYKFFYDHLKVKYGKNVELLYTDTDSFILQIQTDCFYSDMLNNIDKFDTSDYPEPNVFNIPRRNKKGPGLFTDELKGQIINGFVGLRSKMYCVKIDGTDMIKKAKGVKVDEIGMIKKAKGTKKYVLNKKITMKCIQNNCSVVRDQNSFRSKNHTVFSINQTKMC